jgi:hypothetical protein
MDIRTKAVLQTSKLELRDANDELLQGVSVTVYGPGSKQYAAAQARQSNRMIDALKKKGKTEQTPEKKAAETAEFLSDVTVSFDGLEYDGLEGKELAMAVYSDTSIGFIADQVAKHCSDWSNFTRPATTNS